MLNARLYHDQTVQDLDLDFHIHIIFMKGSKGITLILMIIPIKSVIIFYYLINFIILSVVKIS
jgi:hypothetical protein